MQCVKCGSQSSEDLTFGHCLSCLGVLIRAPEISQSAAQVISDVDEVENPNRLANLHQTSLYEKLKPHQKEAHQFMWKNCFADWQNNCNDIGGCILAHYMG
eukprot:scaffold8306_cov171-Amphora_coffeaeformis.AAC.5